MGGVLFIYSASAQEENIDIKVVDHVLDDSYVAYQNWLRNRLLKSITGNGSIGDTLLNVQLDSSEILARFDTLRRLSVVPVYYDRVVQRYLEVYLQEKQDKTLGILARVPLYMPMIEDMLDRADLPIELKYMAVIESALVPTARSRSGAVGLWQFMYYTGKLYGLRVNSFVDERRDPVKSTEAAIHYLKDLYEMFDDWLLAIAAYNCGPGNVRKAIRRAGTKADFEKIYRYLPRETRGYVPAFMAAMYVLNHATDYGLYPDSVVWTWADLDTIHLDSPIHMASLAAVLPVRIEELRILNPMYRRDYIPVADGFYKVVLPYPAAEAWVTMKDSVYAYERRNYTPLVIAPANATRQTSPYSAQQRSSKTRLLYYTVKEGDNLGYIAEWFDCSVRSLMRWNGLRSSRIRAGKRLKIYVPAQRYSYYASINRMSYRERMALLGRTSKSRNATEPCHGCYRVRKGDTLWEIARRYNLSVRQLKRMNNLYSNRLQPGQILRVR